MSEIKHKHRDTEGMFSYEVDGEQKAAMVYDMENNHKMRILHTEVDDSLKGQGIGKKLQAALVDYARAQDIKVVPLCSFADATFQKNKEWQDVLAG